MTTCTISSITIPPDAQAPEEKARAPLLEALREAAKFSQGYPWHNEEERLGAILALQFFAGKVHEQGQPEAAAAIRAGIDDAQIDTSGLKREMTAAVSDVFDGIKSVRSSAGDVIRRGFQAAQKAAEAERSTHVGLPDPTDYWDSIDSRPPSCEPPFTQEEVECIRRHVRSLAAQTGHTEACCLRTVIFPPRAAAIAHYLADKEETK